MVNINFSLENFQGVEQGSTIVLRWPDKDDPNTIVLIFEKPAKLKVTNLKFSNEQPIMNKDAVTASVTIFNEGQLKSESYIVSWIPDLNNEPDSKITSSTQNSIFPGTSDTFDLPAHVF